MYARLLRPLLFCLPAELAHRLVLACLALLQRFTPLLAFTRRVAGSPDTILKTRVLGLELSSPIGLAAGLDKDATAFEAFAALGFGFVEVGTVTPEPQPGNDPPRLFRLPRDRALINRMGFNNAGVETIRERLARPHRGAVVGANIGKNKLTPNDRALDDYVLSAKSLAPLVDYLVVNVSSPNTPGLRDLQAVESLRPLLLGVKAALAASERTAHVPLLLKISPDLSDADIDAVADLALELSLDGIIATNTTLSRDGLLSDRQQIERAGSGGLSGAPLATRARRVLGQLRRRAGTRLVLISVGGIASAEDAWDRICCGANLVQVYTSLIYEGPALVGRINRGLAEYARRAGFANIQSAVGSHATETRVRMPAAL